ncbi:MAG TPA: sugar ABC transporter permease [Acetobacteraceae bacterium]|nr:sugar ABC transporter permease [Acetobacteraceae bacterium]
MRSAAAGRPASAPHAPLLAIPSARALTPWALLAPALVATSAVVFLPVLVTLWMSLHRFVLFEPRTTPFVGLANYASVIADPTFWASLARSLVWIVGGVSLQFSLGFAAALLLNRRFAWRGLARALIVIPWALPSVIIGLIWTWMLDFNLGVINTLLVRLDLFAHPIAWLAQPDTAMIAVILALTWQGFPFFAVTLLAGLQGIPREHYEAASIDGAGAFGAFRHVTLPGLAPVMATALLLRMIWVANSLDLIFIMTGGGPGTATETLPLYAFLKAWTGLDYGYGSALAVMLTLLLLAVVAIYTLRDSG